MGALHEGHLSLIETATRHCERIIVSIFVNPSQFAPHEDFSAYPRTLEEDIEKLKSLPVHLLYAPTTDEVYPSGFATTIKVSGLTDDMEGAVRPHFFDGVATIVAKLFSQCQPDIAIFGEKDYQQLAMIKRLAQDMDMPIKIIGSPTIRDPDGLALSSRNAYLTTEERPIACELHQTLQQIATEVRRGDDVRKSTTKGINHLHSVGFSPVDYLEVRDAETLDPLKAYTHSQPARILVAATLGTTRLIDNIALNSQ